jgi:hypothetical protein
VAHVDPVTKARLFERADAEMTSASAILRRALVHELARVERAEEQEGDA